MIFSSVLDILDFEKKYFNIDLIIIKKIITPIIIPAIIAISSPNTIAIKKYK